MSYEKRMCEIAFIIHKFGISINFGLLVLNPLGVKAVPDLWFPISHHSHHTWSMRRAKVQGWALGKSMKFIAQALGCQMLVSHIKHWEFAIYNVFFQQSTWRFRPTFKSNKLVEERCQEKEVRVSTCKLRFPWCFFVLTAQSSNLVSGLIDFIDLMNSFGANLQMSSMSYCLNVEKEKGSGCSIARDKKSSPSDKRRPQVPIAQPARNG